MREKERAHTSCVGLPGERVESLGLEFQGFSFRVSGLGSRLSGLESRVSGFGFRVLGFRLGGSRPHHLCLGCGAWVHVLERENMTVLPTAVLADSQGLWR